MEPLVVLSHRGKLYKTKADIIRGMNPQWYEILVVTGIQSMEDSVKISVFDEDILMEKPVGEVELKVRDFAEGKSWLNLHRREGDELSEEPTAKLQILYKFLPN